MTPAGAERLAFHLPFSVTDGDIDILGHANNVAYVRWIQDVAVAHWRAVATEEEQKSILWVVLRHEIDYRKPAFAGDALVARTWVSSATKLRYERLTEISRAGDGTLLANARTLWCPVGRASLKPLAVTPDLRARFYDG